MTVCTLTLFLYCVFGYCQYLTCRNVQKYFTKTDCTFYFLSCLFVGTVSCFICSKVLQKTLSRTVHVLPYFWTGFVNFLSTSFLKLFFSRYCQLPCMNVPKYFTKNTLYSLSYLLDWICWDADAVRRLCDAWRWRIRRSKRCEASSRRWSHPPSPGWCTASWKASDVGENARTKVLTSWLPKEASAKAIWGSLGRRQILST